MNKKITKLDSGCAKGCKTYGSICRPKGCSNSRTQNLKNRAAQRIVDLLKKGYQGDRLARKVKPIFDIRQLEYINFHNEFANCPKIVQFAYWRGKLGELREEFKVLEETKNFRKIKQNASIIQLQIEEVENTMRELFEEIKKERKVISRKYKDNKHE